MVMYIRLYQINQDRDDNHLIGLNAMMLARKFGYFIVLSAYYDLVFDGPVDAETLYDIVKEFDTKIPNGYKGRNIISSDVIEVIYDNVTKVSGFFFVDGLEFRALESFNTSACRNTIKYIKYKDANDLQPGNYYRSNMED